MHLLLQILDLFLVLSAELCRRSLLTLVREIGFLDTHLSSGVGDTQSEIRLIKHLNREVDRLRSEVNNQGLAFELALIVAIHFNARLSSVKFLRKHSISRKRLTDLFQLGVEGDRGNPDSGVHARLLGLSLIVLERQRKVNYQYHQVATGDCRSTYLVLRLLALLTVTGMGGLGLGHACKLVAFLLLADKVLIDLNDKTS